MTRQLNIIFLIYFFSLIVFMCKSPEKETDHDLADIIYDTDADSYEFIQETIDLTEDLHLAEILSDNNVEVELEIKQDADLEDIPVNNYLILKGPYSQNVTKNSIIIAWESDIKIEDPRVLYWTNQQDKKEIKGVSSKMVTTPELLPPDAYENYILIYNLKPDTLYYYEIKGIESEAGQFKTAPEDYNSTVNFAVFGDTRTGHEAHKNVVDTIAGKNPEFVVHTGDFVMSGVALDLWKEFFEIEEPLLKNSPLFPVFGNHELGGMSYFLGYFYLPEGQSDYPTNYTFHYGSIYFLILDTNTSLTTEPALSWIETKLKQANELKFPYIFMAMHAPIYTFGSHKPLNQGKEVLHPLFKKYNIQMVFAGHNHCYEHFLVDTIHYITTGGGGAPLYDPNQNVIEEEKEKYWIKAGSFYHFLMIKAETEQANINIIKVQDQQTEIFESFTIYPNN